MWGPLIAFLKQGWILSLLTQIYLYYDICWLFGNQHDSWSSSTSIGGSELMPQFGAHNWGAITYQQNHEYLESSFIYFSINNQKYSQK